MKQLSKVAAVVSALFASASGALTVENQNFAVSPSAMMSANGMVNAVSKEAGVTVTGNTFRVDSGAFSFLRVINTDSAAAGQVISGNSVRLDENSLASFTGILGVKAGTSATGSADISDNSLTLERWTNPKPPSRLEIQTVQTDMAGSVTGNTLTVAGSDFTGTNVSYFRTAYAKANASGGMSGNTLFVTGTTASADYVDAVCSLGSGKRFDGNAAVISSSDLQVSNNSIASVRLLSGKETAVTGTSLSVADSVIRGTKMAAADSFASGENFVSGTRLTIENSDWQSTSNSGFVNGVRLTNASSSNTVRDTEVNIFGSRIGTGIQGVYNQGGGRVENVAVTVGDSELASWIAGATVTSDNAVEHVSLGFRGEVTVGYAYAGSSNVRGVTAEASERVSAKDVSITTDANGSITVKGAVGGVVARTGSAENVRVALNNAAVSGTVAGASFSGEARVKDVSVEMNGGSVRDRVSGVYLRSSADVSGTLLSVSGTQFFGDHNLLAVDARDAAAGSFVTAVNNTLAADGITTTDFAGGVLLNDGEAAGNRVIITNSALDMKKAYTGTIGVNDIPQIVSAATVLRGGVSGWDASMGTRSGEDVNVLIRDTSLGSAGNYTSVAGGYAAGTGNVTESRVLLDRVSAETRGTASNTNLPSIRGGKAYTGGTFRNSVTIRDSDGYFLTYGGETQKGDSSGNRVEITRSHTGALTIGGFVHREAAFDPEGNANGNTVILTDSYAGAAYPKTRTVIAGGLVEGGRGDASFNTVTLDKTETEGSVWGGKTDSGDTLFNTVIVTNGSLVKGDVAAGSTASGLSYGNRIEITDSAVLGNVWNTPSPAANGDYGVKNEDGTFCGNTILITNSTIGGVVREANIERGNVYGQTFGVSGMTWTQERDLTGASTGRGDAAGNRLELGTGRTGVLTRVNGGVTGAETLHGNAYQNTLVSRGAKVGGSVTGASARDGEAFGNVTAFIEGEASGSVIGASAKYAADRNSMMLSDFRANAGLMAAFAVSGSASGNMLVIENGSVEMDAVAGAVRRGVVSENVLQAENVTLTAEGAGAIAAGIVYEAGDALGNSAELIGGRLTAGYLTAGGLSADGRVSGNYMGLSDMTLEEGSRAFGGASMKGGVSGNTFLQLRGTADGRLWGGLSRDGDVTGNQMMLADGLLTGMAVGGESFSGDVTGNRVLLSGMRVEGHDLAANSAMVFGGLTRKGAAAENQIVASNSVVKGTFVAGSTAEGEAFRNLVSMSEGVTAAMIAGGFSLKGDVYDNTVFIEGGTVGGNTYVGYAEKGDVTGGILNFSNGTHEGTVFAGYAVEGGVAKNAVAVTNGDIRGGIYGGFAHKGDVAGNSVTISGGKVSGHIYAGYADEGRVSGNTVCLLKHESGGAVTSPDITGARIYGANDEAWNAGLAEDNVLVIGGWSGEAAEVKNFSRVVFKETEWAEGSTVLAITGSPLKNIGSVQFDWKLKSSSGAVPKPGDHMYLARTVTASPEDAAPEHPGVLAATKFMIPFLEAQISDAEFEGLRPIEGAEDSGFAAAAFSEAEDGSHVPLRSRVALAMLPEAASDARDETGESVTLTSENEVTCGTVTLGLVDSEASLSNLTQEDGSSVIELKILGEAKANGQADVLADSRLAGTAFVDHSGDMAEAALTALALETHSGVKTFATASGNASRYGAAGGIRVNGWNFIAGLGGETSLSSSRLNWALFFENGTGDYRTHNRFGGEDLNGRGRIIHNGGGLMGRLDAESGWFAEASVRVGNLKNKLDRAVQGAAGNLSGYRSNSVYAAAHMGLGRRVSSGALSADFYGRYLWSTHSSDTVTADSQTYRFGSVQSHRTKLGTELACGVTDALKLSAGLAWEYDFGGTAHNRAAGVSHDVRTMRGSTGIGSFGVHYVTGAWKADAEVRGYTGERNGASGRVQVTYSF